MKRSLLSVGFGLLAALAIRTVPIEASRSAEHQPRIVRLQPEFNRLVPADTRIEKIADGYTWVEGPVWNRKHGYLLFSDIPGNSVFRWREGAPAALYLRPSGYSGEQPFAGPEPGSNGLTFDAEGRLVMCEHGDRRIARLESDGRQTTLAARYQGRRLNSPNDLVYHSNGDLYFTDPPFGLPGTFEDPAKELPFQGVYRLKANGELTVVAKDLRAPNGIAFSPSEKTLYVSNADRGNAVWMAYEVKPDGTLGEGRKFFDATSMAAKKKGAPDGMKVDREGNVYGAGPGGIYVISPKGQLLGMFEFDTPASNCAWGGDGNTLFVTAGQAVYRIRLHGTNLKVGL